MKKLYTLCTALFLFSVGVFGQQFSWIGDFPLNFNQNPGLPVSAVTVLPSGDVVTFRLDSNLVIYGSELYGHQLLECRDGNGNALWNLLLGPKAFLRHVQSDGNGNSILSGFFMDTLALGSGDTLVNTLGGLWTNAFLASISPSGQVNWKRNLSRENPDIYEVGCLARHPDGSVWYAHSNFSASVICRLDANGLEQRVDSVSGIRILSGLSFDPQGNRYLSGANESGVLTVNDLSINPSNAYGQFIARVRVDGSAHWAYSGHDITFQRPEVVAGPDGSVSLACAIFDTISWGNISFNQPQSQQFFYLVHADSSGFFNWGLQMPPGADPFTYFQPLAQHYLNRLSDGTIVLIGEQRGTVDWGNGVVLSGSASSNNTALLYVDPATGDVIHGLSGGSGGFDYTQSLAVGPLDECWFSSHVTDSATYGPFLVNAAGAFRSILGKVSAPSTAGVSDRPGSLAAVFPNPTQGPFMLRALSPGTRARVFSPDGRLLFSLRLSGQDELSLERYPAGIYLLELSNDAGVQCLKLVRH